MILSRGLALLVVLAIPGCATAPPPSPAGAYRAAIFQSAVFDPTHVRPLVTIAPTEDTVDVVSWTLRATADKYYHPGTNIIGVDVWVTRTPELAELCRSFPHEPAVLTLPLQQALGLPPAAEDRLFVVMQAHRGDIMRPCPDPDPAKPACGADFPAGTRESHKA